MLDSLIADGIKYLFVYNSDNLGATLDLKLLNHFASSGNAFMMEVGLDYRIHHICKIVIIQEAAQRRKFAP